VKPDKSPTDAIQAERDERRRAFGPYAWETEVKDLVSDVENHQRNLASAERAVDQMQDALEKIRNEAATKTNGGAWAAGIATLCLATLTENWVRLSASELACYRWPEDTAEHRALRAAFMDGAASAVSAASAEVVQTQDELGALLHAAEAEVERLRDERAIDDAIQARQEPVAWLLTWTDGETAVWLERPNLNPEITVQPLYVCAGSGR
jgi:chromosome segregation ATPase